MYEKPSDDTTPVKLTANNVAVVESDCQAPTVASESDSFGVTFVSGLPVVLVQVKLSCPFTLNILPV